MTEPTKELLVKDGTFNYIERESVPESIGNMRTFWLIGRTNQANLNEPNGLSNEKESAV